MKLCDKLIVLIVLVGCLVAAASSADDSASTVEVSARKKFQMPKLFDFARFKDLFKKSYNSVVEELIRQKLFLARAFRSFMSHIKYRHQLSSYYLKVNHMSDWTPQEYEATLLKPEGQVRLEPRRVGPAPMATEEEIAAELAKIQENADKPVFKDIAEELNSSTKSRRRRDAQSSRRDITIDDLMGNPDQQEPAEVQAKIQLMIPSNNPEYEDPERMSFGSETEEEQQKPLSQEEIDELTKIGDWREVNPDDDPSNGGGFNFGSLLKNFGLTGQDDARTQVKPDEVFVDHRETGCFFVPRNQGGCGSCYSFAFTSLIEYLHCRDTGSLTPFSEQYIIDCGYRKSKDLSGCDGGNMYKTGQFISEFGIELRVNYPYTKREDTCPYRVNTPAEKMGYLKPKGKLSYYGVGTSTLERLVKLSPLAITIATHGTDFQEYGGGVHDLKRCPDKTATHAVLLIGHGREDGKEYWLIRNSYGVAYGEAGYYKLEKAVNCIFEYSFTYKSKSNAPGLDAIENEENDNNLMKKQYMRNLILDKTGY